MVGQCHNMQLAIVAVLGGGKNVTKALIYVRVRSIEVSPGKYKFIHVSKELNKQIYRPLMA